MKPWKCHKCGRTFGPGGRCPACHPKKARGSRAASRPTSRRAQLSCFSWQSLPAILSQAPSPAGDGSNELLNDLMEESSALCDLQELWNSEHPGQSPLLSPWAARLAQIIERIEAALTLTRKA